MSKKNLSLLMLLLFYITPVTAEERSEFALLNEEKIGDFNLGLSEQDLKGKIPCPLIPGKEELWEADGIYHQTWDYPACGISFGMSSAQKGDSKTVESINLTSPSTLKTRRGIQIGSSEQDVIKVYQKEKDSNATKAKEVFVAGSVYGGLFFQIKNDKVESIFLGAGAE